MIKNITAIVLQTRKLSDSSKIAVVLSEELGKISLVAKGAFNPKNKLSGIIQSLNYLDFEISFNPNKDLNTIRNAEINTNFSKLSSNPIKLHSSIVACEFIIKTLFDHDPHPEIFTLLKNYLSSLNDSEKAYALLTRFLYKYSDLIGYKIDLNEDNLDRHRIDGISIDRKVHNNIIECSKSRIRSLDLPDLNSTEIVNIASFFSNYLSYHLEKGIRINTLELIE